MKHLSFASLLLALTFCACQKTAFRKNTVEPLTKFRTLSGSIYRDPIFSVDNSLQNIFYRSAKTYHNTDTSLKLDVYLPAGDTTSLRPTIVMIHGGGFTGGSEKDISAQQICDSFARRGYVTISIGYRLGYNWSLSTTNADSIQKRQDAVYRATQDARAAIRFIKQNAAVGKIDTNRIFLAGISAGAGTALHAAYLDPIEIPSDFVLRNGMLDSAVNGYSAKVAGVINIEGAIIDTTWIQAGNAPLISLYGTSDQYYQVSGSEILPPHVHFFGGLGIKARLDHLAIPNNISTNAGDHGSVYNAINLDNSIRFIRDALLTQL